MPPKQHVKSPLQKEIRQDNSVGNSNGEEVVGRDTVADPSVDVDILSDEDDLADDDEDMGEDQDDGQGEGARDGAADGPSEEVPQAFRREDQLVRQTQDVENGEGEQGDAQADIDMEINLSDEEGIIDDAAEPTASETAEDLLNEIKTNWGIYTLRKLMVPGINKNKNLEDRWLSGETDIADEEWEMNTLRLFRNLSRLTQGEFNQAKKALAKKLSYRKHNENGGRTGGDRSIEKEPRLRNDLREVIWDFKQKKREAEDEEDNADGEPIGSKKKKQKTKSSASVNDDDDDLDSREAEIWKKGKKKRKDSSKLPDDEAMDLLGPQQHEQVESSSSPEQVPAVDPREKNAKASLKEKAKATQTPKRKRKGKKDDDTDSTPSQPPTATTIQSAEERDTALERINENLGTASLLEYLPASLRTIGVDGDAELDWEIIARMLDLSNAARTEAQRDALRQALADQVAGRAGLSTEAVRADIALAGEQYHVEEQAKINNRRSSTAPRSARQSQAESPTQRRLGLRSQSRQEVPPVTGQPAEAVHAPSSTARASGPGASTSAHLQPKHLSAYKNNAAGSGSTPLQPTKIPIQEGAGTVGNPSLLPTAAHLLGQERSPRAPSQLSNPPLPPTHLHIGDSDTASRRRELDDTRRRLREAEAAEENFVAEVRRTQTIDENAIIRRENARHETERRRVEMELAERAIRGDDAQVGLERHAEPGGAEQQRDKRHDGGHGGGAGGRKKGREGGNGDGNSETL